MILEIKLFMLSQRTFLHFRKILGLQTKISFFLSSKGTGRAKVNYYSLLGISQAATQAEIKAAYLKKGKKTSNLILTYS